MKTHRDKNKPNVLVLMTDEQRIDSMGCYGSSWAQTPFLDRFAHEGVLFRNAVTPSPVCQPARAALLTGRYPNQNNVWCNLNQNTPPLRHLVHHFAEAGYATASFGKHHYDSSVNRAFQYEYDKIVADEVHFFYYHEQYSEEEHGVVHYPPKPYPWILGGRFPEGMEKKAEADVVRQSIKWLEQHPSHQPFFLRLSFNSPHTPVSPPYPFDILIDSGEIIYPEIVESKSLNEAKWISESLNSCSDFSRLSPEQIREARRYYYGEVSHVDYQFGQLLRWMDKRQLLDNTIVVFLSDHGTHIGDYGLVQKQTFYEPVIKVPYFFWNPRFIHSGVTIETPVETLSLLPTLMELTGLPLPEDCIGMSLCETLRSGKEPNAKPVYCEFTLGSFDMRYTDRLVMVLSGDWKLSLCLDPEVNDGALYNLAQDPFERSNLYNVSEYNQIVEELTRLIINHVTVHHEHGG